MNRRRFLELAAFSSTFVSGCNSQSRQQSETDLPTDSPTGVHTSTSRFPASPSDTSTATDEEPPTATDDPTASPRDSPNTIFVDATSGQNENSGARDGPVATIKEALSRAQPGEIIYVNPGEYREELKTVRSGQPEAPITITGPPGAVLKTSSDWWWPVYIRHSHIHLTGLTIDGLEDPSAPNDPNSHSEAELIFVQPQFDTDSYLQDIVISPHGVGNCQKHLVALKRVAGAEVGPFRVIGPAGTQYFLGDKSGRNAEIVYVGTSPSNLGDDWHPWTEYDRTNNIRVHHIDNSEGYAHSELVDTKLGTHDITVEYCTDGGGSGNTMDPPAASIRVQGYDVTVRWCDLKNGDGHGIMVGNHKARNAQQEKSEEELTEGERRGGVDNSVYGNRVNGFDQLAFWFPLKKWGQTPEAQKVFCGNQYDGTTEGKPAKSCHVNVPQGDGIGHLGGDSPWA